MYNEGIGIEKISYYLPKTLITSQDLANQFDFERSFIETKIGVKHLYQATNESVTDLAEHALESLLSSRNELRDKIQLLVVCTQTPEFQLPQTSAQLQDRCGLSNSVASFDISLGCSGYVYGLSIVESLMVLHGYDYGVLITAEKYSSIINDDDRNTKCLFSDAASATLLSRNGMLIPGQYKFGTDGTFYDSLIVRNDENIDRLHKKSLNMDGRKIFNFTVGKIPNEISLVCKLNDVKENEIDYYVLHQASSFLITSIAKKSLCDDKSKFVNYMEKFGNTVSSSIPIALCQLVSEKNKIGKKILLSGFGVGLSWGTVVLSNKMDFNNE